MKIFLPFIALMLCCVHAFSQEFRGAKAQAVVAGSEQVIMQSGTAIPLLVKFRSGNEMDVASLENFFRQHCKSSIHFGIKLLSTETDQLGFTHQRYQQTFDGIPVEGTMY